MTTSLSNRQYPMLRALYDLGSGYMSLDFARTFDQRPFRSMLVREYCEYVPKRGFRVTQAGIDALQQFATTDIKRKNPTLPLTAYFDPTAYGLKEAPPKKGEARARRARERAEVHVMRRTA